MVPGKMEKIREEAVSAPAMLRRNLAYFAGRAGERPDTDSNTPSLLRLLASERHPRLTQKDISSTPDETSQLKEPEKGSENDPNSLTLGSFAPERYQRLAHRELHILWKGK
jgi:hypothetical protein